VNAYKGDRVRPSVCSHNTETTDGFRLNLVLRVSTLIIGDKIRFGSCRSVKLESNFTLQKKFVR